ncbi:E3 ubiquitin-protein ligase [Trypanosoma brucei equiperdum]|uniref:E3 ubiquitin-protein ligase n=1 Tax=Trypanosoma brucei equiperdum TaxID=630700 RepID=A0A3L6L6I2_9TRYP|nr:E3 ubiquitin-protein ligase [Trypanosoma brucei equiperdum]
MNVNSCGNIDDVCDHDDQSFDVAHFGMAGQPEGMSTILTIFTTVSARDAMKELHDDVEKASEILDLPEEAAFLVLRHYNWKLDDDTLENYMNSQSSINCQLNITDYSTTGITYGVGQGPPLVKNTEPIVCPVCEESVSVGDGVALARCHHFFCAECLRRNLVYAVNKSQDLLERRCPKQGCCSLVTMSALELLLPPQELKRAQQRFLTEYLSNHPSMRCCPNELPCDGIVRVAVPRRSGPDVCCARCDLQFCFKCTGKPHAPATCEMLEKWRKLVKEYEPSLVYIQSNTKECPNCHVPIEKDKGCNHMTCTRCRHEYCWVCLGPWVQHNNMYYQCQRGESVGEVTAEKIFLSYYTRWTNHKRSLVLEEQSLGKGLERARELAQLRDRKESFDRTLTVLQEAQRILRDCRGVLMNACVSLFFTKSVDETFHYRVRQLELCTEETSELIDVDPKLLDTDKIQRRAGQATHWCKVLRMEEVD